jgi:hypothetical protein
MTAKERRLDRVMRDTMHGSDEYYRNHPDQPKEIQEMNRKSKEARDQWEFEHYGTVTNERDSRDAKYEKIIAVPVEIEVTRYVDNFVKMEFLEELEITYSEWVERCYKERLKQILNDPGEFGKVILESKKRGHVVNDDDLEV